MTESFELEPSRVDRVAWEELRAAEHATRAAAAAATGWLDIFRREAGETVSRRSLDELLREAFSAIAHLLRADAVSLLIASEDGTRLIGRAAWGLDQEIDLDVSIPAGEGVAGPILKSGRPRLVDDLRKEHVIGVVLRSSGHRSFAGVPLKSGDRTFGVLHATRREFSPFSTDDTELLLRFAEPIASAIERVRLFEAERSARVVAERATDRLRSLQHVTAALASAADINEICELIIYELAPPDEGGERAIWTMEGSRLVLMAGVGQAAAFPEIPLDAPLPAGEIVQTGRPCFVESRSELIERWPVLADVATMSFAGLPLISDNRRLGVLAVGYRSEHRFDEDERNYLTSISEQAASALARAEDRAALEAARNTAEERREQLDFLAEASERLGRSLDLDVTLQTVAELVVPRLADRCALYLLDGASISKQVLAPELSAVERELFDATRPNLSSASGVGAVIRTGVLTYVPEVDDEMLVSSAASEEELALLRKVGFGGVLILPLRARNRSLGALALVNRSGRPLDEQDRSLAIEVAARAAMAIDNALAYEREAHVARRLIESLLPSDIPEIPGLDIGVRFESGSVGLEIGGDFYDVLRVAEQSWLVLVGDVQGKGVEAAAVTGLARHTIRASADYESSPAELLGRLNRSLIADIVHSRAGAHPWDAARLCTAALYRFDRKGQGWQVTGCSAGHPLPLLMPSGGPPLSVGRPHLLLGVDARAAYADSSFDLTPGSWLVLYTDGVVERPRQGLTRSIGDLVGASLLPQATASEVATAVIAATLENETPSDDMLVLALHAI